MFSNYRNHASQKSAYHNAYSNDDVTSSTRSSNFRYKLKTATFTK